MTGDIDCATARLELGVYLLGAIEPAGRALVNHHLTECPRCREELAGLAGLPALLRKVPIREAAQFLMPGAGSTVPGPLLEAALARAARIRRRRRRLTAAAAAALIAATAAAWATATPHAPARPPAAAAPLWAATAQAANPATHAWAAVRYTARPWGTELAVRVTGIPPGTRCQLWVTGARGQHLAAGGWIITGGHQPTWYPASVPVPAASVRGFEVTAAGKPTVIVPVRHRPPGTRRARTGTTARPGGSAALRSTVPQVLGSERTARPVT